MRTDKMIRQARVQMNRKGRISEKLGRKLVVRLEQLDASWRAGSLSATVTLGEGVPATILDKLSIEGFTTQAASPADTGELQSSLKLDEAIDWITHDGRHFSGSVGNRRVELDQPEGETQVRIRFFNGTELTPFDTASAADTHIAKTFADNYLRTLEP